MEEDQIEATEANLQQYFFELLEQGFKYTGLFEALESSDRLLPHSIVGYIAKDVMLGFMGAKSIPFNTLDNEKLTYAFEIKGYMLDTVDINEKIRASIHGAEFCLFMAGLYPENLERRGLDSASYENFASAFYAEAFGLQMARDTMPNPVFDVISRKTPEVVKGMHTARDISWNFTTPKFDLSELFQ